MPPWFETLTDEERPLMEALHEQIVYKGKGWWE